MHALSMGSMLIIINVFSGSFAILNYTSSIFDAVKTDIHPNTNTTIIGVVQIIGTITAIILVDRYGRKMLLMLSTASMGICLAAFGMYAFFAEETSVDLTPYRSWLPLLLMALIILAANVGVIPVTFVVLVEILPPKVIFNIAKTHRHTIRLNLSIFLCSSRLSGVKVAYMKIRCELKCVNVRC